MIFVIILDSKNNQTEHCIQNIQCSDWKKIQVQVRPGNKN